MKNSNKLITFQIDFINSNNEVIDTIFKKFTDIFSAEVFANNVISNSYDFMSIPDKYINNFYNLIKKNRDNKNICYSIYSNLKNEIDNINFIYDDNYTNDIRTPLIKYLSDVSEFFLNFNIRLFGALMFLSLFEMNFIKENMFILKSTKGKGVFCIL